jgi:gluconolactonase
MSNLIPVDLLSFATNPSYLNNLVATNLSIPDNLQLLAYDPSFTSVIGENVTTRQLHNFADWEPFHEAGVYNKAANKLYVTSNWAGDLKNPINITTIDLSNNYSIASSRYPDIAEANGGTSYFPLGTQNTYGNGSTPSWVLICDQGDFNSYGKLVSLDPVTNETEVLVNNFLGRNFSAPNDVRQHPLTGDLWFTDAQYGYYQGFNIAPSLPSQVYRFSPRTGEIAVVATDFDQANGLEFSPDLKTLYVTDTGASLNITRPSTIYAFDISADAKRLSGRRTFAFADTGIPDGIHTDTEGNVWAGCGDGIHVWNQYGLLIGKVYAGVTVNNFAFLPGRMLVFGNSRLWVVEGVRAVGREVGRDFGV